MRRSRSPPFAVFLLEASSCKGTFVSQRQRSFQIIVFEGAGEPRDLGGAGTCRLGGVAPCGGHGRDLFDDRPGLGKCEASSRVRLTLGSMSMM